MNILYNFIIPAKVTFHICVLEFSQFLCSEGTNTDIQVSGNIEVFYTAKNLNTKILLLKNSQNRRKQILDVRNTRKSILTRINYFITLWKSQYINFWSTTFKSLKLIAEVPILSFSEKWSLLKSIRNHGSSGMIKPAIGRRGREVWIPCSDHDPIQKKIIVLLHIYSDFQTYRAY